MKQNILKFLLLTILISFSGCLGDDVDIESNRRLLVKGKITDTQGAPLANISVITSAHDDDLGSTLTDADGNFNLVSLDEQFDPLDILINANEFYNPNINTDYGSRSYLSTQHTNRVLYELGTIVLGKRATLNFNINNIPGDNTLNFELKFTPSDCQLPLNIFDPPTDCNLSENITGNLASNSENKTFTVPSILGSTALFEYSLNGNDTQTIEIPLTNPETNYVFEY